MKKVLVIDDDRVSRDLLAHMVEKLGFVAIQSGNGRHGWETLWENNDISFVITDMAMPDMDGRELVHLIRNDESVQDIPVIIISGCFSSEELGPLLEISPERTLFIAKPVDPKTLEKEINKLRSLGKEEQSGQGLPN